MGGLSCLRESSRYSYHYPELYKLVPDQYKYARCARAIMDRKNIDETTHQKLNGTTYTHLFY